MQLHICADYAALSEYTANEVVGLVTRKPGAAICIAAGHTPSLTCKLIVEKAKQLHTDFSEVRFFGLDEWVGIPPDNPGTCLYFLQTHLFNHLNFSPRHISVFNSLAANPADECVSTDRKIAACGGLDLMIVGIGMNGHIGFNEPGVSWAKYAHVVALDEVTKTVGQKYFTEKAELAYGVTLGLQHLREAKKVLLIANGEKKAVIMQKALEGEMTERVPASIIQSVSQAVVVLDQEAASLLRHT